MGKGIQYLSNLNMILAALLAIFVFVLGPTVVILDLVPSPISTYFFQFFEMASRTGSAGGEETATWLGSWTSWTPFGRMFLARISRGRSIREFLFGVRLVPYGVSSMWFAMLHQLPGGAIVAVILLGTFFITSADSASVVMGSLSPDGCSDANPWLSATWGLLTAPGSGGDAGLRRR